MNQMNKLTNIIEVLAAIVCGLSIQNVLVKKGKNVSGITKRYMPIAVSNNLAIILTLRIYSPNAG